MWHYMLRKSAFSGTSGASTYAYLGLGEGGEMKGGEMRVSLLP